MSGQAGRSLVGSRWADATDATGDIDGLTNEAIRMIEAFLGASNMSIRIKDTWKRVKNAVGKPARGRKGEKEGESEVLSQIARDVQKTLHIVEQRPVVGRSYADVARASTQVQQKEIVVPLRQRREIIIDASSETPA